MPGDVIHKKNGLSDTGEMRFGEGEQTVTQRDDQGCGWTCHILPEKKSYKVTPKTHRLHESNVDETYFEVSKITHEETHP